MTTHPHHALASHSRPQSPAALAVNEDFTRRHKFADIGRWHVTRFIQSVAASLPPGTSILDAGAGECVYKPLFAHCDYRALDLAVGDDKWNYAHLDYTSPLHDMPIADNTFDAVLCTQTLEHLEWPRESVREIHRVLRPGGTLYLTVPMAHCEHQAPYDFFRYTSYGLRSIMTDAGFPEDNIDIKPFGGIFTRLAYELPRTVGIFPPSGITNGRYELRGLALLPVKAAFLLTIRVFQCLLLGLERFDHVKNDPFGWQLTARKG